MRYFLAIVFTLLANISVAQDREIQSVIRDQIEAFRADDFAEAFEHASPGIRQLFGSSQRFGQMVQQGYPMVQRPSGLTFLEQRNDGGLIWQRLLLRDAQGRGHVLDYQMIQTKNGWKINGVQLLPSADPSA
ncbi:DUF4864 domain-containing protein [Thalassovita sp.]|jgi:hypothetical protein|uniref:DUF4864 domain-containing protein n=1 Tax=Thalassovita sp. TaxID=1979401 RepID=UPI003B5A5F24